MRRDLGMRIDSREADDRWAEAMGRTTPGLVRRIPTCQTEPDFWKQHEGRFVVMSGEHVAGFFDSDAEALAAGQRRFRETGFRVTQLRLDPRVHFATHLTTPAAGQQRRHGGGVAAKHRCSP